MNTFRAGTLRDRIHILRRTGIKDEWGLPLPQAWENLTSRAIAADVRHNSGLNAINADADVSVVRASIRIRRRTDVDAGMRVLFGGPLYEIEAIYPGRNGECIDLVCKRIPGHKT
ncbi:MAG: phage head closure protein [Comamonas sp.]|jgi:SPP1 family predicted phage head-tail adaptor|nr:phage head closure protein [Comamonas sp.]